MSYSRADAALVVGRLAGDLKASGFDVWIDVERSQPGSSWTRGIEQGIDQAGVVLAFLSKSSFHSDICRAEQLRALRKNKRVLPILLQRDADVPVHLESEQYLLFYEGGYAEQLQRLLEALDAAAMTAVLKERYRKRYRTYPPLPQNFTPRPALMDALRKEVIREKSEGSGIGMVAIWGMGGVGKTVLAQALCHDEVVQDAFPDGLLWANIGQNPSKERLCEEIRELAKALGDTLEAYDTLVGCQNQLRNTLSDKSALIVLDDVWDPAHVQLFNADAPRCCLLLTTRNQAVVSGVNARALTAQVMDDRESRELLARKAGLRVEDLPPEASPIVQRCGGLPLALSMMGARARKGNAEWNRILDALDKGKAEKVSLRLSDYRYATLFEASRVSVELLTPEQQSRYLDLAVFPPNTGIPPKVLETFWNTSAEDTCDTIESWVEASLAYCEGGLLRLHSLQLDFVRSQARDLKQLHRSLLSAYRRNVRVWSQGPDDGYYYSHLCYHLAAAGQSQELVALLLSPDWVRARLGHNRSFAVMADYDWAPPSPDLLLIQQALQLSAHVLGRDPRQLAGQLLGRLRAVPTDDIQTFLAGLRATQEAPWLEPLIASLWKPGAILVSTLAGHAGAVKALAVQLDGKRVLSASDDHTLKLWDLEVGAELLTLRGHTAPVNTVVIAADGGLAVSSSYDKTMRVWDLRKGKEIRNLTYHSHLVNALAITPDDKRVISAAYDKTLKVWDLASGNELHTLAHQGWVTALATTGDAKRVISASHDQTLKVWDLETGSLLHTLAGHTGSIDQVLVTPDGTKIVSASHDKSIRVWDLETGEHLQKLMGHTGRVNRIAVTTDGTRLVSASQDGTIRVWDLNTAAQLHVLAGHTGWVTGVLLLPGGRRAVSVSDDSSLKIWDIQAGSELQSLSAHSGPVTAMVAPADSTRVVSVNGSAATLKVWNLESASEVQSGVSHFHMVNAVAISPEGLVISGSSDRTLIVRGLESEQPVRLLAGHTDAINAVAVFAQGSRAVSASSDKTLRVWDLNTGSTIHTLPGHSRSVEHVAVAADGKVAVSCASDRTLKIWDLEKGEIISTLRGHSGWVRHVVLTSDGKRAVSASYDHTVRIWDLQTGEALILEGHESWVNAIAITSLRIVSASYDHTLRVWDANTGLLLHTLFGHTGSVSAVTVTRDGKHAISASYDHTLRVWDLATGAHLCTMSGHMRSVTAVLATASHEPGLVVSASNDNTIKVWTIEGHNLATFSADGPVVCLALHGDNRTIVAGDYLGCVHRLRFLPSSTAPTGGTR